MGSGLVSEQPPRTSSTPRLRGSSLGIRVPRGGVSPSPAPNPAGAGHQGRTPPTPRAAGRPVLNGSPERTSRQRAAFPASVCTLLPCPARWPLCLPRRTRAGSQTDRCSISQLRGKLPRLASAACRLPAARHRGRKCCLPQPPLVFLHAGRLWPVTMFYK